MIRRNRSILAVAMVMAALVGCDSSTDLAEVTMGGKWDGMGDLYSVVPGFRMTINANSDGSFAGQWVATSYSGTVAQGTRQGESIQFIIFGFPGGTRTFQGSLTDRLRIEGTLSPAHAQVPGNAVFRRSSFSP